MNQLEQLRQQIIEWASDRSLFEKATKEAQLLKFFEELGELAKAINKNDEAGIIDGIGDVFVTQCILDEMDRVGTTDGGDLMPALFFNLVNVSSRLMQGGAVYYAATLVEIAELKGLELNSCIQSAYDEIKNRTGKTINNVFVKDE